MFRRKGFDKMGYGHHPGFMMRRGMHPPHMLMPFMHLGMRGVPLKLLEEIESKEEAIEFMEIQLKILQKRKKRLNKAMERIENIEEKIAQGVKEIAQMKEYSSDEMKKILKKLYREHMMDMLDED